MTRYVVDVMPKREILDPQGKAVLGALPRLGFEGVTDVRQGKRFEVDLDGEPDDDRLAEVHRMAQTLLANPVIEDFTVRVAPQDETVEETVEQADDQAHDQAHDEPDEPADEPAPGPEVEHEVEHADGPEAAR